MSFGNAGRWRRRLWLLAVGAVGLLAIFVVRGRRPADDPPTDALLYGRLWASHEPRGLEDRAHYLVVQPDPIPELGHKRLGGFVDGAFWKGAWELFEHEAGGAGVLRVRYPGSHARDRIRFEARRCHEGGFDYCLRLRGSSRGVKRYVSRRGWEITALRAPPEGGTIKRGPGRASRVRTAADLGAIVRELAGR